jgi:Tol biopolymer transport system component/DNA-binding winged helix-turn-helix (wHTH) protein
MPETQSPLRPVRFGAFEADLRTGELRKDGVKLKFSGQPFQVLAILLERPGEVVTREELQKRLWPDTFVDVERNLNTAVNRIREVLGDSAESPRFVETLPRRGYRFIGEVETLTPPVVPAVTVEPGGGERRREWWKIGIGAFAIAVIALAAFFAYRWRRPQPPPEGAVLTSVPFTALPGLAGNPAFSPDGSRIAFAWSPAPGTNGSDQSDLYVKALGSETLLRLTQHLSLSLSPAWSPEGTQIAFYRHAGADSGIYVVPALGGPERKLRSTRDLWSTIGWSPDGKWIAFLDVPPDENQPRIHLFSTETSIAKRIPNNPTCYKEGFPAFSHNGKYLAYWCFQDQFEGVLSYFSLPDGKPRMIAPISDVPNGLTWSADDTRLLYSTENPVSSPVLGEVSISNGSVRRLGFEGMGPTVSPKGGKLAYGSVSFSSNFWRRDLLHSQAPAVELIPSSRNQFDAQYSPDGKHIAFASMRSGVQGVWMSNEDGSNLVEISDPNHGSGSPQWSPDGKEIAFDSTPQGQHWEIYVADVAGGKPRKLVTNMSPIIRPNWSHDGKWIYFRSNEPGGEGIYRCPASGGDATRLSNDIHGYDPQESFDGKTVYFSSFKVGYSSLKRVALSGQPGKESEVDAPLRVLNWTMTPNGIYFVPAEAPRSVRYFDLTSQRVRPIFEGERRFDTGLSVSRDGRWILYSPGKLTGDIMLVNDFH